MFIRFCVTRRESTIYVSAEFRKLISASEVYMAPCLVIVASLCFHDVSDISLKSPGGLGTTINARGNDYSITVELGGDNIRTPDWTRMQLACAAGACIAYYKRCEEPTLQRVACEYHFSQPGEMQN